MSRHSFCSRRLWTAVDTELPRDRRAECLRTTKARTTAAKACRLRDGNLETAVDDLSSHNKAAGTESAVERRVATVGQADALADAIGARRRFMFCLGTSGPMRPEETGRYALHGTR